MKKIKYLLLLILPILSGCYNYRELNELGITTAVSIDYQDDNFHVIAEVVNPIKQQDASSSNNSPFVNYSGSASTLQNAFRNIVLESPRQLYAAQLEIIVLSEEEKLVRRVCKVIPLVLSSVLATIIFISVLVSGSLAKYSNTSSR